MKVHEEPLLQGRVKKLVPREGYGFLTTLEGREIYFHQNSVLEPGFDWLEVDTEVRFAEEQGRKGPRASTVHISKGSKQV